MRTIIADTQCWLFGICFGHQVIAEAMGGRVAKNPRGWEVGWTEIALNANGRDVLGTDRESFAIHQMHQVRFFTMYMHGEYYTYSDILHRTRWPRCRSGSRCWPPRPSPHVK